MSLAEGAGFIRNLSLLNTLLSIKSSLNISKKVLFLHHVLFFCLVQKLTQNRLMSVNVHMDYILFSVIHLHLLTNNLFCSGSKSNKRRSHVLSFCLKDLCTEPMCVVAPRHFLKTISPALFPKVCQYGYVCLYSRYLTAILCTVFLYP